MSNLGGFRIEIDAAKSGGVSDPRNSTMLKMFNLINIGERAGSGIPKTMTKEQFLSGQSNPVNDELMRVFMACGLVEQSGHGVPLVVEEYGENAYHFEGRIRE